MPTARSKTPKAGWTHEIEFDGYAVPAKSLPDKAESAAPPAKGKRGVSDRCVVYVLQGVSWEGADAYLS